jgi:hypothetical protein
MKKVFSIISAVVVAAVLTLNVTLSKDSKTGNVSLASITAAPEASAECVAPTLGISGHCIHTYEGECVFGSGGWDAPCDPYR